MDEATVRKIFDAIKRLQERGDLSFAIANRHTLFVGGAVEVYEQMIRSEVERAQPAAAA